MDPQNKKISLSFKQAQLELQKQEYQKYIQGQDDKMTLGDIMKDQLKTFGNVKNKVKNNKREEKDDKS
jgi:small subunit ribosomal protein S1